jgi:hypothetical protein
MGTLRGEVVCPELGRAQLQSSPGSTGLLASKGACWQHMEAGDPFLNG